MNNFPPNIIRYIYDFLDDEDLAGACVVNKEFSEKICNNIFWLNKIIKKYPFLTKNDIDSSRGKNTYWAYYLNISSLEDGFNPDGVLFAGVDLNRIDLIKISMNRGAKVTRSLMNVAAQKSNPVIFNYLLDTQEHDEEDKEELFSLFLIPAARGGNIEVLKLLLPKAKGFENVQYYLNVALSNAIRYNHKEAVILLIDEGADVNAQLPIYETTLHAAEVGTDGTPRPEIITLLLERGAKK